MYIEYFNIMNSDAVGSPIFISISFLIIMAILIFIKIRNSFPMLVKLLPILTVIGIIGLSVSSFYSNTEYRHYKKLVMDNKHSSVEGVVEDFNPLSESKLIPESFKVNGIEFSYFDDKDDSTFHESFLSNGPIMNGLNVRIFYYENKILALWIKES